jgi:hypothetical protein
MTTPADIFDRAGRALFGDQYVAPMAALLDVEKDTVSKWREGKSGVPVGVWKTVAAELLARQEMIGIAIIELSEYLATALRKGPT